MPWPGISYYLSYWYKSSEIDVRMAVFFSAAALAGSFGSLSVAAIAQMEGIGNNPDGMDLYYRRPGYCHCGCPLLVDGI